MDPCNCCKTIVKWKWNFDLSDTVPRRPIVFEHHKSWNDLCQSADRGCGLCLLLGTGLLHWMEECVKKGYACTWAGLPSAETYLSRLDSNWKSYISLEQTDPGSNLVYSSKALLTGFHYWWSNPDNQDFWQRWPFFALKLSGDEKVAIPYGRSWNKIGKVDETFLYRDQGTHHDLDLAAKWLKECIDNHDKCVKNVENTYPTRLLHIETSDDVPIVRMVGSSHASGPYVALSHRWGNPSLMLTTTMENYSSHLKGIPVSNLPKSFQDAVAVAMHFHVEHLWIDSLCIIQDSGRDWEQECPRMAETYANAILTIAIADAEDSTTGFLHPYPESECGSYKICHPLHEKDVQREVLIDYISLDDEIVSKDWTTTLSKRGWVFQERMLSPRVLSFRSNKLHWECNHCCYSSDRNFPFRIDILDSSIVEKKDIKSLTPHPHLIYAYWTELISIYSRLQLTKESDRLPALSGLAKYFSTIVQDKYVAGLWRKDLRVGLGWYSPKPSLHFSSNFDAQADQSPSWSWVSYSERIEFPKTRYCRKDLFIISASAKPIGLDPFGGIKSSKLVVAGRLEKGHIKEVETSWKGLEYQISLNPSCQGTFYPDHKPGVDLQAAEKWPEELFALLLTYDRNPGIGSYVVWVAMVIAKVPNKKRVYCRVGLAVCHTRNEHYWFDKCSRQVIALV
jgi:hypothetical protein